MYYRTDYTDTILFEHRLKKSGYKQKVKNKSLKRSSDLFVEDISFSKKLVEEKLNIIYIN